MVERLNYYMDRPWMVMRKGKEVTELWLSQQLRRYGIRPRNMRIGEEQAKGYGQEDFAEVFRRYIPLSEVEALRTEVPVTPKKPQKKREHRNAEHPTNER